MGEREDEWWHDWRDVNAATKWGGESWTSVEEMYQAFKARLMRELVAARDVSATMGAGEPGTFVAHYPLVALRSGERENNT